MKKAENLSKLVDEAKVEEAGQTYKYKKGTDLEGMLATKISENPDGTFNMRVGSATKVSVSPSDLEQIEVSGTGNGKG